jgi:hypothetical protein
VKPATLLDGKTLYLKKKKKWWNAHTVPALPEKKIHVLAGAILFVSPFVHQC